MVMDNRTDEENKNEQTSSLFITNFQNGETVNYSIVLIKGLITSGVCNNNEKIRCIICHNGNENETQWDVHNREFKIIIELKLGENVIDLHYSGQRTKTILLYYEPRKTNFRVTPLYIICQGHDGCFQSPPGIDNSVESACARIMLGAKLIQSVTAEKLFESGFGRKTFQLEHEIKQKKPECILFRSKLNVNKARKMNQKDLWAYFGHEIMVSNLKSDERKFLAFIACTRFKGTDSDEAMTHREIVSLTEAHVALGGGALAVFGTGCLYTWPTSVEQIIPKLLDANPVNCRRFMDDSAYRGTLGGCFATTLGSVFHELGHAFDLGHTNDGIMGRGFDNIHRVFLVGDHTSMFVPGDLNGKPVQHSTVSFQRNISVTMNIAEPLRRLLGPRSKTTLGNFASMSKSDIVRRSANITPITRPSSVYSTITNRLSDSKKDLNQTNSNDSVFWTRNCAVFLTYHRWFNNEYGRERQTITRYLKFDKNKMMIISTAGIRIIEVRDECTGLVLDSYEFTNPLPEKRFMVPFKLSQKAKVLTIVVEDDLGNVLKQTVSY